MTVPPAVHKAAFGRHDDPFFPPSAARVTVIIRLYELVFERRIPERTEVRCIQ